MYKLTSKPGGKARYPAGALGPKVRRHAQKQSSDLGPSVRVCVCGQRKTVGFAGRGNGFAALHKRSCDHRLARVILCAVMKPDERSPACR